MFDNNKLRVEGINSKGFGTIPKLLMQDRNLHITSKAIYAYLCSYAGGGETCFPTRNKVCFDLNISKDTFGKYLKELIKFGYIRCEQIKENGKFSHNVYTLCSEITVSENTVYGNSVSDSLDTNINNNKNNNNKNNNVIFKEKYKKENFESDTITTNFQNLPVEDIKKRAVGKPPQIEKIDKKTKHKYGGIITPPEKKGNAGKMTEKKVSLEDILVQEVQNNELREAYREFIKYRKQVKASLTEKGLELLIRKVNQLAPDSTSKQIELLENAIMNGWKSVWETKEFIKPTNNKKTSYQIGEYETTNIFEKYAYDLEKEEEKQKNIINLSEEDISC